MPQRSRLHPRASALRRALARPATWAGILAALAALLAPATAGGGGPVPERAAATALCDMQMRDVPLADLLGSLARGAGLEPAIGPGIAGTATCVFRNVPWERALAVVCRGQGLQATVDGKSLRLEATARRAGRPEADSPIGVLLHLDGTVSIEACAADVGRVLREIEQVTGRSVRPDRAMRGAMACSIQGLPLDQAIAALAAGCDATVVRKNNAFFLVGRPAAPVAAAPVAAAPPRHVASQAARPPLAPAQAVAAGDAALSTFRDFGAWLQQHPPMGLYKAPPHIEAPTQVAAARGGPRLFFAPADAEPGAAEGDWAGEPGVEPAAGLIAALPTPPADPRPQPAARPEADGLAVNMEFRDTEIDTVLRTICQGAGVDFVLDPAVTGKVTAKLKNTSWQKALDIVLKSHGLEARPDGDAILIAPARPGTKAPDTQGRVVVTRRDDGRLDVDASGADIRAALHKVATAAGLNIVTARDVTGAVTASLQDLSAQETLVALADSCGATISERGQVIHVQPRPAKAAEPPAAAPAAARPAIRIERRPDGRLDIHARQAQVRDLLAELAAAAGLNIVASESLVATTTLDLNGVSPADALAAVTAQAGLIIKPLGGVLLAAPAPPSTQSDVFRLRYADAAELGKAMEKQLEGAKIAVVAKYNLLVVTGPPEVIAAARMIIEKVEEDPIQVTIETLMIETNLIGDKNIGIQWQDSIGFTATCPKMPYAFPFNIDGSSGLNPGYDPSDSRSRGDSSVPFADVDDFEFGFLSSTGLSAVINMLKQDTSTKMVARPTITTMENQQAKINMVTKYPVAQYQVATDTGVLQISGFEYKEFGTILEVTPRVDGDHVVMTVHPEVSRQAGTTTFANAELPLIASQETTTQVRIKDGDTLVIAGLVREDSEESERRVPWLGRLPCIGPFFRNKRSKIDQRRHLLIFITPHIVRDADFAKDATRKEKQVNAAKTLLSDDGDPKTD